MKLVLLIIAALGLGAALLQNPPVVRRDWSDKTIFQKREIPELHLLVDLQSGRTISASEVIRIFENGAFGWSRLKAEFFVRTYRHFAPPHRLLENLEQEERIEVVSSWIRSNAEVIQFFPHSEDLEALSLIFANNTHAESNDEIQFSSVAILGLQTLKVLEIFREKNLLQQLDPHSRFSLALNWNESYPKVWEGLPAEVLEKNDYDEVFRVFYEPIKARADVLWIHLPLHSSQLALPDPNVTAFELRVLANPESSYEHSKRALALDDNSGESRFFYSTGFLVVRNSRREFCSLPLIGQSQQSNQSQLLFVTKAGSNVILESPEDGLDISGNLLKLKTGIEDYPEVHMAFQEGALESCQWSSKLDPYSVLNEQSFVYTDGHRYFYIHLLKNPVAEAAPSHAVQAHQLPLFRRGLWQTCAMPEEKLWSFFGNISDSNLESFEGGLVGIEPIEEKSEVYQIYRVYDAKLTLPTATESGSAIEGGAVLSVAPLNAVLRQKSVEVNLLPLPSGEFDFTDQAYRTKLIELLISR